MLHIAIEINVVEYSNFHIFLFKAVGVTCYFYTF